MKLISKLLLLLFLSSSSYAQKAGNDSAEVAKTFKQLLQFCRVDFSDPKVQDTGLFYKCAPYIVYRGDDKKRAWKDFANYSRPDEKKGVDYVCYRINSTVNQDSNYVIHGYLTETQSEGKWHVLLISYMKRGVQKKASFAFLKIRNRFALGDID